jgi:hypothetical protein
MEQDGEWHDITTQSGYELAADHTARLNELKIQAAIAIVASRELDGDRDTYEWVASEACRLADELVAEMDKRGWTKQ